MTPSTVPKLGQQSMGERGTDSRQALKQKEPPRRQALRFPVEATKDVVMCLLTSGKQRS
jgi:hypothetical protein